ncbi:hypothetical protein [Salininema proteolyticum]|uniref:Uncharacterized protein n=1 Tax=Salininema proteolyticum TaxID=1607685 RepID=A0ABV8TXN9_9ACTN
MREPPTAAETMPATAQSIPAEEDRRRQLRDVAWWLGLLAAAMSVSAAAALSSDSPSGRLLGWWPSGASPFPTVGTVAAPAILVAVLGFAMLPRTARWPWHSVLALSYMGSFAWTAALHTQVDTTPPSNSTAAARWGLAFIDQVSASRFGIALILCALGSLTTPLILVAVKSLAGPLTARTVAPVLILGPWAIWVSVGMDGIAVAAIAAAVACAAKASERRVPLWTARACAASAGALLAAAVLLSYSAAWFGLTLLCVYYQRRRATAIWWSAAAGVAVLGTLSAFDHSWPAELVGTYAGAWGALKEHPAHLWSLAATPALAFAAAGPAAVASLRRMGAPTWPLMVGPLAAMVFTPLVAGAVPRAGLAWIALTPWLVIAATANREGRRSPVSPAPLVSTAVAAVGAILVVYAV